jgi:hypothetical protein
VGRGGTYPFLETVTAFLDIGGLYETAAMRSATLLCLLRVLRLELENFFCGALPFIANTGASDTCVSALVQRL